MVQDASFRRYYRIRLNHQSWVVMDAPPSVEKCGPYVAIAHALRDLGLDAPEVLEADFERGFLLISDFGDLTYLRALNTYNADSLYQHAMEALVRMQTCNKISDHTIPPFTENWMHQEWQWHQEWFLNKLLALESASADVNEAYVRIVNNAVLQPQVFMHRDYHSANLMVLANERVGILDFQDAFIGPITYDLASLLRDCYIAWPISDVQNRVMYYWHLSQTQAVLRDLLKEVRPQEFLRWFDWMSIQRHLKALFTFARKHVRDHHAHYLQHVPRTLNYVIEVTEHYPELAALHHYYKNTVLPVFRKRSLCVQ
jgi:aminoglycoside/choline kinase family phosphotransferase